MSAPGGIPPHGEPDLNLARAAVLPTSEQLAATDYVDTLRRTAGAIATARAEGARAALEAFEALFSGEPDTPCRTTWRDEWAPPAGGPVARIECVEVPIEALREAFDEAERTLRGEA